MRHLIAILLVFTFACNPTISIYNDYDREIDIAGYKTFGWRINQRVESNENPIYYNELNDKRIRSAVNMAMESKGYRLNIGEPQLLIHYHIIVEDKSIMIQGPQEHEYYWIGNDKNSFQYKEGTLIIDLMDSRTNGLIWRGWATAVLEDIHPDTIDKRIKNAIDRIFKALPSSLSRVSISSMESKR